MNENEFVTLPKWVGKVQVDLFPAVGGCTLLLLSDREMHILKEFVVPFAEWQSRFVRWLYGDTYQTATQAEYDEYLDVVGQLFSNIGGMGMDCTGLVTALENLASAVAANEGGTTVNCGGGGNGCGPAGSVAQAIAGLTPEELLPQAPLTIDEGGPPPEGFASWESYRVYKCKAAHQIWYAVDQFAATIRNMGGIPLFTSIVAQGLLGYTLLFTTAFTVVGLVLAIAAVLAIEALSIYALSEMDQFRAWWLTNKDSIVCSLYTSGDASTALQAISNAISDGVQAIEWTGALAPISVPLSLAVGVVMSQLENNNLVNTLFQLVTDVAFPDATCDCVGAIQSWHFDEGLESWTFSTLAQSPNTSTGYWTDDAEGQDTLNGSPGRLIGEMHLTDAGVQGETSQWQLELGVGNGPVMHTGDKILCDLGCSQSGLVTRLGCYFDDNTYQISEVPTPQNWSQHSLVVSGGNDGKRIHLIWISTYPDPYVTGTWIVGIDRVYIEAV